MPSNQTGVMTSPHYYLRGLIKVQLTLGQRNNSALPFKMWEVEKGEEGTSLLLPVDSLRSPDL
ncbi:MAG TPA: hypothetical protein EYP49_12165 [Anaerolineae bacterium]|nr:hypothetical protein [Anaerolineae bacterium]